MKATKTILKIAVLVMTSLTLISCGGKSYNHRAQNKEIDSALGIMVKSMAPQSQEHGESKTLRNAHGFAMLVGDSIAASEHATLEKTARPSPSLDSGYTNIYSNYVAFAALKTDGSIRVWGEDSHGGYYGPTDSGYTKIYSNQWAFAAIKADGSITAWGSPFDGGTGAPTDNGYIKIYSTNDTFGAVKADGSSKVWGYRNAINVISE